MFDITGADIASLNDTDLRTLVARLAQAELSARRAPLASVTAGGAQDAADGGIDVRVDQATLHADPDFVPRAKTGFQVKKPDLAAQAIKDEMRPDGVLRPSIVALAEAGGAYIIASSGASLTDITLERRRVAMRDAIADHPNSESLFVDVYDRDRLATWVNQNPGVAAWVRRLCGRPLSGWRSIGTWRDLGVTGDNDYLIDDTLSLIDERDGARTVPIADGMGLLRKALHTHRECVRLIGLSGVGKTRLVEALFEADVGNGTPLDPGVSVYADYAEETTPTAREMASRLVEDGLRAILVVDNCNPKTHAQLADVCSRPGSQVSLLTVEYDIRDDEPEHTQVFRLAAASDTLIEAWLERDFPHVMQSDRNRIAQFSGGNFRVARALANTVGHGETLGRLRDQDLFERIFIQRNDPDKSLLHDAQTLALFYSFDISEGAGGELDLIATFAGRTAVELFGSVAELQARGVLQARGRWRAVLPHAIANPLAAGALKRFPSLAFDDFCQALPERMRRSMSRRLGFLHDVREAQSVVARWLKPTGPAGDLLAETDLAILSNIAPVDPAAVLTLLQEAAAADALEGLSGRSSGRGAWIHLLKALAYDADLFSKAATLLARLVAAEPPDENYDSARRALGELFQLYLSGTQATPEQRRALVAEWLDSPDPGIKRAGRVALDSILIAGHFSATSIIDFGARPRGYGWQPSTNASIADWYESGIDLVLSGRLDPADTRKILADTIRDLWRYSGCRARLIAAADAFSADGGWLEGWTALRVMMQFDGHQMPEDIRAETLTIIRRLAPKDLIAEARAYVLSVRLGAWDVADGDEDYEVDPSASWRRAEEKAREIGRVMVNRPEDLIAFLPKILISNGGGVRSAPFGVGLGEGTEDPQATWTTLCHVFALTDQSVRNPTVLGNFLKATHLRDATFVSACLDAAVSDPDLGRHFCFLQVATGLDSTGIDRVIGALDQTGSIEAFRHLSNIDVDTLPASEVARLVDVVVGLPHGPGLAIDMLWRYFYRSQKESEKVYDSVLVDRARRVLTLIDLDDFNDLRDSSIRSLASAVLAGEEGRETALVVSHRVYDGVTAKGGWRREAHGLVDKLFKTQPEVALDVFVDGAKGPPERLFKGRVARGSPLDGVDTDVLIAWADRAPERRYARLGEVLSLFRKDQMDNVLGINPAFTALLEHAPDKAAFLGEAYTHVHPSGWSGSLAEILTFRKGLLDDLPDHPDIAAWRAREYPRIDRWIAAEREREAEQEESFE
ncbi:hypothetical protein [Brevundimonas pishanensis]|uniref:hypothetical protein n=1 Tax=Brevundimonas pishanensis TaxID=2896315 RepID=UPI001FA776F2|nr:hypothetical protein [Brevundimonas pishanensis]